MLKEFCSKCGHPNLYSYDKPLFCAKCGGPFGGAAKAKVATKSKLTQTLKVEAPLEVEEEVESIPNINKLDFSVETFESKAPTIGAIASQGPPSKSKNLQQQRQQISTPFDKDKFIKALKLFAKNY